MTFTLDPSSDRVTLPDHTQLPESDGTFVKNFQEHPQSILLTDSIQQFQIQNDFAPFQRFTEILRIINFSWCKGFRAVKF